MNIFLVVTYLPNSSLSRSLYLLLREIELMVKLRTKQSVTEKTASHKGSFRNFASGIERIYAN